MNLFPIKTKHTKNIGHYDKTIIYGICMESLQQDIWDHNSNHQFWQIAIVHNAQTPSHFSYVTYYSYQRAYLLQVPWPFKYVIINIVSFNCIIFNFSVVLMYVNDIEIKLELKQKMKQGVNKTIYIDNGNITQGPVS